MSKFLKLASLTMVLLLILSMTVCVSADELSLDEPYTYDASTGEFVIYDLSVMGMSTLPANVFQGMENSLKVVKIEDEKITAIEEMAFLNCFRLEKVYIPETVAVIEEGAFWGCPGNIKIYGPRGSAAEDFAEENGYTYKEYSGEEKDTDGSIAGGVSVTILGVGVVFLILVILCVVLKVFEVAFGPKKNPVPAAPAAQVQKPVAPVASTEADDTELVAVISAAIATSLGTSTSSFRIKSLRRLGSGWNQAAKLQNFNNNF